MSSGKGQEKEMGAQLMRKILALLLLTVCMAVYSMVDIGAAIFLLDQSYQGKKQIWCRW